MKGQRSPQPWHRTAQRHLEALTTIRHLVFLRQSPITASWIHCENHVTRHHKYVCTCNVQITNWKVAAGFRQHGWSWKYCQVCTYVHTSTSHITIQPRKTLLTKPAWAFCILDFGSASEPQKLELGVIYNKGCLSGPHNDGVRLFFFCVWQRHMRSAIEAFPDRASAKRTLLESCKRPVPRQPIRPACRVVAGVPLCPGGFQTQPNPHICGPKAPALAMGFR